MEEQDYRRLADACLQRVAGWLEGLDDDEVDYTTSDGKVAIEFPDGLVFVVNRQGAARQIWFAAVDRAWHYRWDAASRTWVDDRDGHEFFANLADVVGRQLGHPVVALR